jgi:hypothetical protein
LALLAPQVGALADSLTVARAELPQLARRVRSRVEGEVSILVHADQMQSAVSAFAFSTRASVQVDRKVVPEVCLGRNGGTACPEQVHSCHQSARPCHAATS